MRTRPFASVLLVAAAAFPAIARADDWSITTADFHAEPVTLRGLSAAGVHVASPDGSGDRTVPLGQFVSAQRNGPAAAATTAPFTLSLAGGDRLVGEPSAVAGESLRWAEPLLGAVPVPLNRLVSMARGGSPAPSGEDRPKQDVVTLANGDTVAGVFAGVGGGRLTVQSADGTPTDVPLSAVARAAFANTGGNPPAAAQAFRVRLADGSAVTAAAVDVAGDAVSLTLAGKGSRPVPLPLADVVGLEQLNGPVSWLSGRTPTESVQVPYLGGSATWPARFDAAVDGGPLMLAGRPVDHGIGVHAYSRLTFPLEPGWAAFRTQYAIDSPRDTPRLLADVVVRIKVDGKIVHEQRGVRVGSPAPVVRVDVAGGRTLTLECDYGPAGDTQAHLDWLQPALLREPGGK